MENKFEEDEVAIDFKKIFKILEYRKKLILRISIAILLFFIALTFILPKKYSTGADLYVSKTNDTNMAELNPYLLSSLNNPGGGISGMLTGSGMSGLQNEIAIMQSPLVMDNVIRENNLRYKTGKKKGEFLSTKDFLKKNIIIADKKGTNIISIEYKSKKPLQSYNVVNSIIENYKKTNEKINTKKAVSDKKILKNSYAEAQNTVNQKLSAMKNSGALPQNALMGIGMLNVLKGHNKAVNNAMGSISSQAVEGQKSQIAVEQEVGKLNMLKEKFEWASLVEEMSKNTGNVIVLKYPEIKRSFEYSNPKFATNFMLGVVFSILASIIAVIWAENNDKKLTYSDLGEKIIYNIEDNFDDLKIFLYSNSNNKISLINFENFPLHILQSLNSFPNLKIIQSNIDSQTISEITNSDKIILTGKIGQTPKKIYHQIKNICKDSNKNISAEII